MWSLADSQALDQPICCFGPGSSVAGWSPALGLSWAALGSAAFSLWVGQLASAPGATHPRCQVWAPSPLIWVCASRLQARVGAAWPVFIIQGLRGQGRQWPMLLWGVL